MKILLKTMDATTPSPERIELSEVKKLEDGTLAHVLLPDAEVCISACIDYVDYVDYIKLCHGYLISMSLCHGHHIEVSYRVLH